MTARPIPSISANTRVAAGLRQMILAGDYAPGERIVQEELAEHFGASRLPVRDALRLLEAEGLVTLVPNTGAWVAKLSLEECEEVYQIRERVEPLLVRMSIPALDPAAVLQLRELCDAMRETDSIEEFLKLDRDFHNISYSGAQTSVLGEFVSRLWNTTQHYRRAFTQIFGVHSNRTVHLEHELLVLAIERGDVDEAERIVQSHIRSTRLSLVQHPEIFQEPGVRA